MPSTQLNFKPITPDDMPLIWHYLELDCGRSCDFSYGGILMWISLFDYQFAIDADTLFITGRSEDDMRDYAFALPMGSLPLSESVALLRQWTQAHGRSLTFSAIPEYAIPEFRKLNPVSIKEQAGWGDYIYDAEMLATLSGRKMAKKRNHVNKFKQLYGDACYQRLNEINYESAIAFLKEFEREDAPNQNAAIERRLAHNLLTLYPSHSDHILGGMLVVGGEVVALTIGDIKGDTLYIHVEKAIRGITGSYEMINYAFAADMLSSFHDLKYINREDDSDDEGLRQAKLSYHPVELLAKYTISF